MQWASAVAEGRTFDSALDEVAGKLRESLGDTPPDLIVAFASEEHRDAFPRVAKALRERFPDPLLFGCSAHSVIGGGREIEEGPGLSLTAAVLPGVTLRPFHVTQEGIPEAGAWDALLGPMGDAAPAFLLLADPFSIDVERVVKSLDASFPGCTQIGGLASGGGPAGGNVLWLGDGAHTSGLVGIALTGDVVMDAIVAQGCRPVGNPMFVTRSRGNWLLEVDGRGPLEVLGSLYAEASPEEQDLFRHSLLLGIEMRSGETQYQRGDFLIRNLVGSDAGTQAIAVAAEVRETQVVQFHLRDARTAAEDLAEQLRRYPPRPTQGALLFSCLGRGQALYGAANHDSQALQQHLGELPLGGFFCNGEIGPVQGHTFLHGYTSSFALFRPAS